MWARNPRKSHWRDGPLGKDKDGNPLPAPPPRKSDAMPRKNLEHEEGFKVPDDAKRRDARVRRQKAKRTKLSKRKREGILLMPYPGWHGRGVMPTPEPWQFVVPPWQENPLIWPVQENSDTNLLTTDGMIAIISNPPGVRPEPTTTELPDDL